MKTEEAIDWLEANKYLTRYAEVVKLLQRGEKYEKMWEELRKDYESHDYIISVAGMDWIKQKYFPKIEVKYDTVPK